MICFVSVVTVKLDKLLIENCSTQVSRDYAVILAKNKTILSKSVKWEVRDFILTRVFQRRKYVIVSSKLAHQAHQHISQVNTIDRRTVTAKRAYYLNDLLKTKTV